MTCKVVSSVEKGARSVGSAAVPGVYLLRDAAHHAAVEHEAALLLGGDGVPGGAHQVVGGTDHLRAGRLQATGRLRRWVCLHLGRKTTILFITFYHFYLVVSGFNRNKLTIFQKLFLH